MAKRGYAPSRKRAPAELVRMAHLCGGVAEASESPRTKVAEYVLEFHRMQPEQIEELAHAWLRGWDESAAKKRD